MRVDKQTKNEVLGGKPIVNTGRLTIWPENGNVVFSCQRMYFN